ncbi:WD40 repeat-like protein [Aureobasidium subglaciale]|nr:WD40 repeat-like protein [Aureobasidium subglaciale]
MTSITSIQSLILDLPPSCIEFCSVARDYFIVGTYYLEKKEQNVSTEDVVEEDDDEKSEEVNKKQQTKTGSLILFKIEGDEVKQISTIPTPYAILDLHFSPHDPTLLAVAGSTGCVQLFRFTSSSPSLSPLSTFQYLDPATLVLSLAWHPTSPSILGVTVSAGQVYMVDTSLPESEVQDTGREILCHDLEAWTLSFSRDGKAVFSGGDDAHLRFSGLPTLSSSFTSTSSNDNKEEEEETEEEEYLPQWQDRRIHQAGVTAILPLPSHPDILVTGSYDDNIRILSTPLIGRKQILAEETLQGGVWRLKMLKSEPEAGKFTILASCMHAGARIVQVQRMGEEEWEIEVLARFEEHNSMNYGSDVQPGSESGGEQTIVSTSFYDKLLCLWRYTLP